MKLSTPKVSIIVPLYNKAAWVARCISSVLGQSCRDFELIVVDDGSTDASASVVNSFRDDRIRIIAKKNGGEASARNVGIRGAKGEYLAFLDADDEWEMNHLQVLLSAMSICPDAIVVCDEYRVSSYSHAVVSTSPAEIVKICGESIRCFRFDYIENLAAGNFVTSCSSTMVRTSLLRQCQLEFNERLGRGVDQNFWIDLSRHGMFLYCAFKGASYHRDDPMGEMARPRSCAQTMPNYFLDVPESGFDQKKLGYIERFLGVEYLKAAYANRGLPFDRQEMACVAMQRRKLFADLLYLGVRYAPNVILGLAKNVKSAREKFTRATSH